MLGGSAAWHSPCEGWQHGGRVCCEGEDAQRVCGACVQLFARGGSAEGEGAVGRGCVVCAQRVSIALCEVQRVRQSRGLMREGSACAMRARMRSVCVMRVAQPLAWRSPFAARVQQAVTCAMRGVCAWWQVVQGDAVSRERGCVGSVGCVKAVPYKGNKKVWKNQIKAEFFF